MVICQSYVEITKGSNTRNTTRKSRVTSIRSIHLGCLVGFNMGLCPSNWELRIHFLAYIAGKIFERIFRCHVCLPVDEVGHMILVIWFDLRIPWQIHLRTLWWFDSFAIRLSVIMYNRITNKRFNPYEGIWWITHKFWWITMSGWWF